MGNIIVGNLVQTGAFEVYLGPELLHSKIATGVLPDIHWLIKELGSRNPQVCSPCPQGLVHGTLVCTSCMQHSLQALSAIRGDACLQESRCRLASVRNRLDGILDAVVSAPTAVKDHQA
jgi:hypothetical protein